MFVQHMYWPDELEWLLDFSSAKQKVHSIICNISWSSGRSVQQPLWGTLQCPAWTCTHTSDGKWICTFSAWTKRRKFWSPVTQVWTDHRPICCTIGRVFRHIICNYMTMTYWTDNIFRDRCAFIASGAMVTFLCCSRLRQPFRNPQRWTLSLYMNLSACRLVLPVANIYIYIFPQVSFFDIPDSILNVLLLEWHQQHFSGWNIFN